MSDSNTQLGEFVRVLLNIDSAAEMEDFLHGILTPAELAELPNRLQIVQMLKQRIPQQKIARDLGVGVATVTRGSKELQKGRFKYV